MILITGATGKVGRHVVARLLEAGQKVRAISRSPERSRLPTEVEVLQADLALPHTLDAALDGVTGAFLFPSDHPLDGFTAAALRAGVRQVVLLSSTVPGYDRPNPISAKHLAHERTLLDSGLPWTFVRPGGFMSNDLFWAPAVKAEGVVRDPFGQAALALIDERDIAAVAVAALLDETHLGKAHEITGPQALTPIERTRILGAALGRELRFEQQSHADFKAWVSRHYPPEYADAMIDFGAYFDGRPGPVYPTVEQITGRPAHTYAEWAALHASSFR